MFYATSGPHGLPHDPIKALVAPRPIGWISSLSARGQANLAPYSYFNVFSSRPPIVAFSSEGMKDSVTNIEETGEFVCNIVGHAFGAAMNATSAAVARGVDEFALAGLGKAASELVKPPRVAGIPAALECVLLEIKPLHARSGAPTGAVMVLGEVVGVHLDDAILDNGIVDPLRFRPLARLGGMDYAAVDAIFRMDRPRG